MFAWGGRERGKGPAANQCRGVQHLGPATGFHRGGALGRGPSGLRPEFFFSSTEAGIKIIPGGGRFWAEGRCGRPAGLRDFSSKPGGKRDHGLPAARHQTLGGEFRAIVSRFRSRWLPGGGPGASILAFFRGFHSENFGAHKGGLHQAIFGCVGKPLLGTGSGTGGRPGRGAWGMVARRRWGRGTRGRPLSRSDGCASISGPGPRGGQFAAEAIPGGSKAIGNPPALCSGRRHHAKIGPRSDGPDARARKGLARGTSMLMGLARAAPSKEPLAAGGGARSFLARNVICHGPLDVDVAALPSSPGRGVLGYVSFFSVILPPEHPPQGRFGGLVSSFGGRKIFQGAGPARADVAQSGPDGLRRALRGLCRINGRWEWFRAFIKAGGGGHGNYLPTPIRQGDRSCRGCLFLTSLI